MKKWIAIGCVVICVLAGGLWYADYRVKEAVGNQVASVLSDPSSQAQINNIISQLGNAAGSGSTAGLPSGEKGSSNGNTAGSSAAGGGTQSQGNEGNNSSGAGSGDTGGVSSGGTGSQSKAVGSTEAPVFTSRQQVVQYAISRFTPAQISHYAVEYAHRSTLTEAQKKKIETEIFSHFTPAEIASMEAAAKKYH